jgi:hypothetical protein
VGRRVRLPTVAANGIATDVVRHDQDNVGPVVGDFGIGVCQRDCQSTADSRHCKELFHGPAGWMITLVYESYLGTPSSKGEALARAVICLIPR